MIFRVEWVLHCNFRSINIRYPRWIFNFDSGISKRYKHLCYLVLNSATDQAEEHLPSTPSLALELTVTWDVKWISCFFFHNSRILNKISYLLKCKLHSPLCMIIEMATTIFGKKGKKLCSSLWIWKMIEKIIIDI